MSLIIFSSLLLCLSVPAAAAAQARTIQLNTQPAMPEVRPLSEPVRVAVTVVGPGGKALPDVRFKIRLRAPEPGRVFSTDLPLVEGGTLLELDLPAEGGSVDWEYVFPIRGLYRLEVTALDASGATMEKAFVLPVKESRLKIIWLGAFVLGLFFLGFWAGRLFKS